MANRLPIWMTLAAAIILVLVLGVIDYLTGDYSILVFYMLPVALAAWFGGRWIGVAIAVLSGLARFVSDLSAYVRPMLHFWNSIEDALFLVIVGLLVDTLRRVLDRERQRMGH